MTKTFEEQRQDLERFVNERIQTKVRQHVMMALTEVLGGGDVLILSAMGIDARAELLKSFIRECEEQLKEE